MADPQDTLTETPEAKATGRPPKILSLSEQSWKAIVMVYGMLGPKRTAAALAGVSAKTLGKWMTLGGQLLEEHDGDWRGISDPEGQKMAQLAYEADRARAMTLMKRMGEMHEQAATSPHLLLSIIRHEDPSWREVSRHELTGADGGPIAAGAAVATPENARRLMQEYFRQVTPNADSGVRPTDDDGSPEEPAAE